MRLFLIFGFLTGWLFLPGQQLVTLKEPFINKYLTTIVTTSSAPVSHLNKYVFPVSLIAVGSFISANTAPVNKYKVRDWRNKRFPRFSTQVDDYLQYIPLIAGLTLNLGKPKEDFNLFNQQVVLSEAFVVLSVTGLKNLTRVPRPDGSSINAFPSGHTTQAFAAATLFSDHFARHKWWLSAVAYSTATSVGILRLLNNRHWISDVVTGAGLGILCVKLSESICKPKVTEKPYLFL